METEQKQPTIEDVIIKPIKDSGKRYTNEHGGMRDTSEGKPKFQYIDSLFLEEGEKQVPYRGLLKFALFMEASAKKYSFKNWKLLNTPEDIKRFKESCYRHYVQWRLGENDFVLNVRCLLIKIQ